MLRRKKEQIVETVNYYPLALGEIKPTGYLETEMKKFVNSHIKKINDTWEMVDNDSFWLGGKRDMDYISLEYISNLFELGYQLNDNDIKTKLKPWIEGILLKFSDLNSLKDNENFDWLTMVFGLKILVKYHEVTKDNRVLEFADRFFKFQYNEIDILPPSARSMAGLSIEFELLNYFYDITKKDFLIEVKQKLERYCYNFTEYFSKLPYTTEASKYLNKHLIWTKSNFVKNQEVYEDLKTAQDVMSKNLDRGVKKFLLTLGRVVAYNLSSVLEKDKYTDKFDAHFTKQFVTQLYENHGLVNGLFSSDYHLDGKKQNVGTDIATAVYTLRAMLNLERLTADNFYTDYADSIFYNALPSMFCDNYSSIQQVQSPNQVGLGVKNFFNAHKRTNLYTDQVEESFISASSGVFNNFVNSLCYSTEKGFAFCHYAPCEIDTYFNGNHLKILERTDYPFGNTVNFEIYQDVQEEITISFVVPKYTSITVFVNGSELSNASSGVVNVKKVFSMGDTITININNNIFANLDENNIISFRMGGLLLVNPLSSEVENTKKGLTAISKEDYRKAPIILDNKLEVKGIQRATCIANVFEKDNPYVTVRINADIVTNWGKIPTEYAPIPKNAKYQGSADTIVLVPYANSYNRISEFPCKMLITRKK